ncbi:phytanoyl-CoA dioxygenase family protein [Variovorax paradoxus]|jgi:ectoine hydroxylase-related dioxygenase (phytanoyl-CoA dioxygenase family)|uniref:phytanoyl-CoA dioxygenase family protein n=1 Tax=Variovorax paradoxus TaxID=34073 RepID=UPI0029C95326|nr:phytanoyl-CoA dioxygenase family protein [Variovorax paradoxus]WPH18262.1 phytanoyl-CoA dioxygenase family protein [Variovorax paradoxus]
MTGPVALLDEAGYALLPALLPAGHMNEIAESLEPWLQSTVGSRNLLAQPDCRGMAAQLKTQLAAIGLLGDDATAVQCTLFDKTADRNWLVALHQDTSIPASGDPSDAAMPIAVKEGARYVQPPVDVLESLLAVRVHLDDCGVDAGPLRVVPGSHRAGRLDGPAAQAMRDARGEAICTAARGDALAMRPLLLHASSRARLPVRRRILHFLFGPARLPHGLVWNLTEP